MAVTSTTVGRLAVSYSFHAPKRIQGIALRLPNYKQRDIHSCGFVAALTVVHHLIGKHVPAKDVLRAVRPSINHGVDRHKIRCALRQLGVKVRHRKHLTAGDLRRCVRDGFPVVVSIWPDEWLNDHWTVVQGFSQGRVYLANHKSMTVKAFKQEWSDMDMGGGQGGSGEGFICSVGS